MREHSKNEWTSTYYRHFTFKIKTVIVQVCQAKRLTRFHKRAYIILDAIHDMESQIRQLDCLRSEIR